MTNNSFVVEFRQECAVQKECVAVYRQKDVVVGFLVAVTNHPRQPPRFRQVAQFCKMSRLSEIDSQTREVGAAEIV